LNPDKEIPEAPLSQPKMKKNQRMQNSTARSSEPHHGDLRKGAYLKRRAAYQMQAGSSTPAQAGTLAVRDKGRA
jgi:hypothetical protein